MLWSRAFIDTLKQTPKEAESASHQLMLRAGLIQMLMAGVYSYLPLGWKALGNVQAIIRAQMAASGATELLLPALQPQELWLKSGRDKEMGEVMIRFTDRRGRRVCLGPTHEEVITELARTHIFSYKQMPIVLYQIQTKFRDEIRPRFGVVRACEFIMKDAYSFDRDQAGLDENYDIMYRAYRNIFERCGLRFITTEADPGVMGGSVSHEFMVPAKSGEDEVLVCPGCNYARVAVQPPDPPCPRCGKALEKINAIEVGHIFQLGTKYSSALEARFLGADGVLRPIMMGCYGIGVSRLVAAIIEQNHDGSGIVWPAEVSPYQVIILPLDVTDAGITRKARELYDRLRQEGIETLLDDRDERAGVKFKDADLVGIHLQVIIGKELLKHGTLDLKVRGSGQSFAYGQEKIYEEIKKRLNG